MPSDVRLAERLHTFARVGSFCFTVGVVFKRSLRSVSKYVVNLKRSYYQRILSSFSSYVITVLRYFPKLCVRVDLFHVIYLQVRADSQQK